MNAPRPPSVSRRRWIGAAAALAVPLAATAQSASTTKPTPIVGPLAPNPAEFKKLMDQFIGTATPQSSGITLDVPALADNPSAVGIKVQITRPLTEQNWCEEILVLAELNPVPQVCRFQLSALSGTAEVSTRVRLSQTQAVYALARMKSGDVLLSKQNITVAASGCGM